MKYAVSNLFRRSMALLLGVLLLIGMCSCTQSGGSVTPVSDEPIELKDGEQAFYVSPDGNDSNDGSVKKPFATFAAAQKAVRSVNSSMQGNIYIVFREGTYTEEISLYQSDSGKNGYDVVLMSYPEEKAEFYGGQKVTGFKKVDGKPYYKTSLEDMSSVRQFYANGIVQPRSTAVTRILPEDWLNGEEMDGFLVKTENLENITDTDGLELRLSYEWQDVIVPVKGIRKANDQLSCIYMSEHAGNIYSIMSNLDNSELSSGLLLEFFLENSVDLIDEPGEWAFDTASHELYYYPAEGVDIKDAVFEIPVREKLLSITGTDGASKAQNITVKDLNFRMGSWDYATEKGFISWQADAYWENVTIYPQVSYAQIAGNVAIENVDNITLIGNVFSNMGGTALTAYSGVSNTEISSNVFKDCAAGAVTVGNHLQASRTVDDTENQLCNNISLNNNAVYNIGESYYSVIGLMVYFGKYISITNNDIINTPSSGISVGWGSWHGKYNEASSNNTISGNRIVYHSQKSRDSGGIYTLDDQPESVIENNYIKDNGYNAKGIYHDQGSGYYTDTCNVLDMKESGYWANDWSPNTHDITYVGNYTSILRYTNLGQNVVHTNDNYILDRNWPLEARNVILSSGVTDGIVRAKALGIEKNLKLWLSADGGVSTDADKNVAKWTNIANSSEITASGNPVWSGYESNENHAVQFADGSYLTAENISADDEFTVSFVCRFAEKTDYKSLLLALGLDTSKSAEVKGEISADKTYSFVYVNDGNKGALYQNGTEVAVWSSSAPSIGSNMIIGKKNFSLFELTLHVGATEKSLLTEYYADKYYIDMPTQENLVLWLDAGKFVTADKDGKVSKWGDLSARRIGGLIQNSSDNAPEYVKNAINGLPALKFDGENDFMYNFSTRWMGEEFSMFIVKKPENAEKQSFGALGGISEFLVEMNSDTSVTLGSNYPNRVTSATGAVTFSKAQLLIFQRYPVFANILPTQKVWESELPGVMKLWNGNNLIGEFDSSAKKSIIEWGGMMLGNSEGNTLNGTVAEILVYDRVLNENEQQYITDYLTEKYSLK